MDNIEQYWWRTNPVVIGYDVGKKGNPSHAAVFAIKEDKLDTDSNGEPIQKLIMISQKFLDGWEYTRQIAYLTAAVEYYNIQRGYYDNTRAELEERNIPRQIMPVTLSSSDGPRSKSKYGLATNFAKLVEQKRIELIDDDRFISQITCVTNDLQAPNTPLGHGDSFISVCLAIGAYNDFFAKDRRRGVSTLGNIQAMFDSKPSDFLSKKPVSEGCKICGNKTFIDLSNGHKKCTRCNTEW